MRFQPSKYLKTLFPGSRSTLLGAVRDFVVARDPNWRGVFAFPPGHFYSPLIDIKGTCLASGELKCDGRELWEHVDLDPAGQENLLAAMFARHELPAWSAERTEKLRYYSGGGSFPYADAVLLALILQEFKPERIVEVGGGFSTAAMLDTLDLATQVAALDVVEPYPERLKSLLRPDDWQHCHLIERPVQEVGMETFLRLKANDILFIDSSHVAKIGSDVTMLLLKVLPALQPGVVVHIHDICYPYTYPLEWVSKGWAWNESIMLRAFLIGNKGFKILAFNSYAGREFRNTLDKYCPQLRADPGGFGGSLWMQKV